MNASRSGPVRAGDVSEGAFRDQIRFDPGSHVGAEADDLCLSVTLHHNQLARAKSAIRRGVGGECCASLGSSM